MVFSESSLTVEPVEEPAAKQYPCGVWKISHNINTGIVVQSLNITVVPPGVPSPKFQHPDVFYCCAGGIRGCLVAVPDSLSHVVLRKKNTIKVAVFRGKYQ